MPRDYYDILGVARNADDAAIKKAYRRLARKYHPDVNSDADAKSKFREVQDAFDVLGDKDKRKRYDQFGHAGVGAGPARPGGGGASPFTGQWKTSNAGPGGFSFRFDGQDIEMDDLFSEMFGSAGGGRRKRGGRGPRGGAGAGFGGGASRGQDIQHTAQVPFDTAARGGKVSLTLSGGGSRQTIDVKVPKGAAGGAKLRVKGKGNPGAGGGQAGDLILTLQVAPHPYFRRDGLDLSVDVPISLDEAVFGATVEVPTLNGRATLKIPPGTPGGRKLRLRGAGIENNKGQKGDLFAVVRIDIPKDLTDEQRELFEQLKGKLPNPRDNAGWA